ncbi:homoserine dehydrogenase [Luteimonas sp. 50]|uniref:Homoserine dehydrogenase n=1 Tax=Cognatiluteimonas sedimenti TaxID=2927791 RepID=A0ABT0A457_9GAMM|nr:homoserine dehydrogenase [Lysobacter sedimenti]MCJ0825756.1 homoserine dehydrogenase [Lysobacter sedimenti]
MNAIPRPRLAAAPKGWVPAPLPSTAPARLALLGIGTVGSALLQRLAQWQGTALGERLRVVHVANSRQACSDGAGLSPLAAAQHLHAAGRPAALDAVAPALAGDGARIVIDATASDAVAARHAWWLAQGIHVVTACKLGQGTSVARWSEIRAACARGGSVYGDSATVGAGLPLLRSIRGLQAGGDRIHAIAGVLSGSLAWLFHHYDGLRPFSGFVRAARAAGYTEPDPREDLSGEDVRRKLLILARSAGLALEAGAVEVDPLLPAAFAALDRCGVDAALPQLDAPLRARHADAWKRGEKLCFVARLDCRAEGAPSARVGLESLSPDDPLRGGGGTDNRVAIWSDRYRGQPLLIQGPGAGAQVTAAALLDDVLAILRAAAQAAGAAKNASIGCGCRKT